MSSRRAVFATVIALSLSAAVTTSHAQAQRKKKQQAPVVKELPAASTEQLDAYKLVHLGEYQCEMGQSLAVVPHATTGYAEVAFKRTRYTMKPVLSSTGAIRLEDVAGRTLMVQIASKSMLLDTKAGQRLVDECQSAPQKEVANAAAKAPVTN